MRLIDLDKADVEQVSCSYSDHTTLEDVKDWLDGLPTISPDSLVKRGRWEITHDYDDDYEAMRPLGRVVKCSECGYPENGVKSNYCPHCGAFMRESALAASGKEG